MGITVTVRFYAELNDLLPLPQRHADLTRTLPHPAAVKDVIESFGVPHPEVDLVLVNGESVGFEHVAADGDRVAVYPVFESFDVGCLARVRPAPLRVTRFVLDVHLGRLARLLRLLGIDAAYSTDGGDAQLATLAAHERRILLTCDRGLLKRSTVSHGYCVRSRRTHEQILEVLRRFDLARALRPLTRCARCNGELAPVSREEAADELPPRSYERATTFTRCRQCGHLYWDGTHVERILRLANELSAELAR
jgi:uncharacterized protein with PIN domain